METTTTTKNLWDFLEEADCPAPHTKDLFTWSLNYDHPDRPFNLFIDIIGYSEEHYGTQMWSGKFASTIGYMEADYLGDALKEWAQYPQQVEEWITKLMSTED
jgi:hypothetical protein